MRKTTIFGSSQNWAVKNSYQASIEGNMGGMQTFAAVCTKVSYAQIATFAKSRGRPKAYMQAFRDK
jgi:hypothetical protein